MSDDRRLYQTRQALRLIAIAAAKGKRVLEITCTEGTAVASLAVVGAQEEIDAEATERSRSFSVQGIRADLSKLPFSDAEFGLAICELGNGSEGIRNVLIEIRRVLGLEGTLIITASDGKDLASTPHSNDPSPMEQLGQELKKHFSDVSVLTRANVPPRGLDQPHEQAPMFDSEIPSSNEFVEATLGFICSNEPVASSGSREFQTESSLSDELKERDKEIERLKANLYWLEHRHQAETLVFEAALEFDKKGTVGRQRLGIKDIPHQTLVLKMIGKVIQRRPYSAARSRALADPSSPTGRAFFAIRSQVRRLAIPEFDGQEMPDPARWRVGKPVTPRVAKPIAVKPYRAGTIYLPNFAEPEVSIIVAAYNNFAKTHKCLVEVSKNSEGVPFEVILVDDASTDQTSTYFGQVENLTFLVNASNLGFLLSCNRGAAAARGKYLLFLNNDTQVKPGWLLALVEPLKARSDVGIVGAKLLYPDKTLQEAGGIIWRDGTGFNYGRRDDPAKCDYNFVREVDYCSGACILVRRDIFEKVGGFDTRFAPAYYEDVDLAFRARELGYSVLYQPRAEVIHDEGSSYGTDSSVGLKRYQVMNQEKFVAKWSSFLEYQPRKGSDVYLARQREIKKKVLIVDATVPTYDQDAGSLRMDWILQCLLEMGFGVSFLPDNRQAAEPYTKRLQDMGIEVMYGSIDLSQRFGSAASEFSACIASRPYIAWKYLKFLRQYAPNCHVIYDTVDLHYLREQRRAHWENNQDVLAIASRYKALELALVRACSATITVTDSEKAVLLEEEPSARVHVIPTIHEINAAPSPFADRQDLLFVGGFNHPPNKVAVRHFVTNIFPTVKAALPGIKLYVVGSNPPPDILKLASQDVIVKGFVQDLDTYLQGCRIAVAPMTFGAGLKGKITQSLSQGLPVVTTSIGAEGTGIIDGRDALIADDIQGFALAVVRLYENESLWTSISEAGQRLANQKFSPKVVRSGLTRLLDDVGVEIPLLQSRDPFRSSPR